MDNKAIYVLVPVVGAEDEPLWGCMVYADTKQELIDYFNKELSPHHMDYEIHKIYSVNKECEE